MKHLSHTYHSWWRRGLYSSALVAAIMVVGTIGMHVTERMSYLDAFYFMSMVATAQGPTVVPATAAGKLFAAFMSFVSVGIVVAALGFLFGPFFTHLWHLSRRKLEEEERRLAESARREGKDRR